MSSFVKLPVVLIVMISSLKNDEILHTATLFGRIAAIVENLPCSEWSV